MTNPLNLEERPNAYCSCEVKHDETNGTMGGCHCRILKDGSHDPNVCKCGPPGILGPSGIIGEPGATGEAGLSVMLERVALCPDCGFWWSREFTNPRTGEKRLRFLCSECCLQGR